VPSSFSHCAHSVANTASERVPMSDSIFMESVVGGVSVGGATLATNPLDVIKGEAGRSLRCPMSVRGRADALNAVRLCMRQ
jgi:hypothetical protein